MSDSETELVIHLDRIPPEVDFLVADLKQALVVFTGAGGKIISGPFAIQIGQCAVVVDPWDNQYVLLDMSKGPLKTDDEGHVLGSADI